MGEGSLPQTDPARELAELLSVLQGGSPQLQGDQFLAEHFKVAAWSQDFLRIVATIMDRLVDLRALVAGLELDVDYRDEMIQHVQQIQSAFALPTFNNAWSAHGGRLISPGNIQPIKGLSGLVRQRVSYSKLSPDDVAELIGIVEDLTGWLEQHQLAQQDFIRQAMIDGLKQLRFRLERFQWLGWGYSLDALREVIAAYMLLERGGPNPADNPDAEAILVKAGAAIKAIYAKVRVVKNVSDTGDWLLKAYAATAIAQHYFPGISGLLGSS